MAAYKRIIFKLSGEALKSGSDLFDFAKVQEIAEIIRENLEEPEYGEPQDVVVHYGLIDEQNNIWGVSEEEGEKLGAILFSADME